MSCYINRYEPWLHVSAEISHYKVFPDVFNFKYTEYLSIKSTLKHVYIEVCLYLHPNYSFGSF